MKQDPKEYMLLEYDIFIEEINKNIFNWDLVEIIEATYTYKKIIWGFFYNKTLFQDYWGFTYSKSLDLWIVYYCLWKKLQNKILQIDYYIGRTLSVSSKIKYNKILLKFLKKQLLFTRNSIEIALYWLPFEMEKSWFTIKWEDKKMNLKKLYYLEKNNFWGSVKSQTSEVIKCYEFLKDKQKNQYKEKASQIQYFLDKITIFLPSEYNYKDIKSKKNRKFLWIFNTKIHRDDYMKIFDNVFALYELPQRTLITHAWSIYDGEKFLEIPNKKAYEYKSLKYILSLLLHEVMAHSINLENTKKYLWNFRWSHNLEKEEGLALLLEKLFQGEELENINIIWSLPALLIWEICTNKDFKKYLSIFYKDPEKVYLRFKRNYSQKHKWVQHKDSTYSRWVLKIRDYLLNGWAFQDLFLGKVSFQELRYLKTLQKIKKDIKIIQPLFVAEMIYYIVYNSEKSGIQVSIDDFIVHMNKKYPFIDTHYFKKYYLQKNIQKNINAILLILQAYIPEVKLSYNI